RPARRGRQDRRGKHLLPHAACRRRAAAQPCGCNRHAALGTAYQRGVTTKAVPSFTAAQPVRSLSASTPPRFVNTSLTRASGGGINLFDNQSREDIS